jgi:hypothetical protein
VSSFPKRSVASTGGDNDGARDVDESKQCDCNVVGDVDSSDISAFRSVASCTEQRRWCDDDDEQQQHQ